MPGDPLAPSALVGLGYLGSPEALPIVQEAIASRSEALVIAATAGGRQAAGSTRAQVRSRSATGSPHSWPMPTHPPRVRHAALEALVALNDPRLVPTLSAVARDANLEGTPLLIRGRAASWPGAAKPPESKT